MVLGADMAAVRRAKAQALASAFATVRVARRSVCKVSAANEHTLSLMPLAVLSNAVGRGSGRALV